MELSVHLSLPFTESNYNCPMMATLSHAVQAITRDNHKLDNKYFLKQVTFQRKQVLTDVVADISNPSISRLKQ